MREPSTTSATVFQDRQAQIGEDLRIAGAVGVQKADDLATAVVEAALDRGAVASVLLEGENGDLSELAGKALGPVGRAVGDDHDLRLQAGLPEDVLASRQAALEGGADGLLFVEGRNHDRELGGAGQVTHSSWFRTSR